MSKESNHKKTGQAKNYFINVGDIVLVTYQLFGRNGSGTFFGIIFFFANFFGLAYDYYYFFIYELPWLEDSEETCRFFNQTATCLSPRDPIWVWE